MSQDLGKIEKPEAKDYKKSRKVYLVPLIYAGENVPGDYMEKYELYWKQVPEHMENLENRIGLAKHIYHESICEAGDDGLKALENLHKQSFGMVKERCQRGACFEALEDKELLEEALDWQRCLIMGFMSQKVADKVSQYYIETSKKRYSHIEGVIDRTLQTDEAALLLINERHMIQFPSDIEVFRVAPPALNEINKWLRDRQNMQQK
ncbi:MAG TPA: hypothetical protein VJ488_03895 [Dehalococcoidia bacterium]|nr:hypothetical protein [Dehalococcoidia bacterium]